MEFSRNQYFAAGLVVLLLGVQLRIVETYVLNDRASEFVSAYMTPEDQAAGPPMLFLSSLPAGQPEETIQPPTWVGWVLISIGAVLILHSLAMKKEG